MKFIEDLPTFNYSSVSLSVNEVLTDVNFLFFSIIKDVSTNQQIKQYLPFPGLSYLLLTLFV